MNRERSRRWRPADRCYAVSDARRALPLIGMNVLALHAAAYADATQWI
jgi:hypothetical protein